MCDPGLIVQGAGAGWSALGAFGAARAQRSAFSHQAKVSEFNARLSERQAQIAMDQGQAQEDQLRREGAVAKGAARQTFGASGVKVGYGTAQEVEDSIDTFTDLDVEQTRLNATREAFGYRLQGINQTAEAGAARASAAGSSPGTAAFTSLLSSASSMASSFSNYSKASGKGAAKGKKG